MLTATQSARELTLYALLPIIGFRGWFDEGSVIVSSSASEESSEIPQAVPHPMCCFWLYMILKSW